MSLPYFLPFLLCFFVGLFGTQEAYEVLVNALEGGAELGECVRVIETELAKRELPGDVRRASREVNGRWSFV